MRNLGLQILCLLTLLFYSSATLANNGEDLPSDIDIHLFLDSLDSKTPPPGFQANKKDIEYIFKTLLYLQDTKPCDDSLCIRFYPRTYYFLRNKVKSYTLALKVTNEYLEKGDCNDAYRIKLLKSKGVTYEMMGNYDESILTFNQALHYAERINSSLEIANVYKHINYVYWCKDLQSGIGASDLRVKMNKKALDLFVECNDIVGIQNTNIDLGLSAKNLDEAIVYFEKAKSITRNNREKFPDFQSEMNYILNFYSSKLIRLGLPNAAFKQMQEIDISYLDDFLDSLNYFIVQADYHVAIGQKSLGRKILNSSVSLLENFETYDLNRLFYLREFSQLYRTLEDYENLSNIQEQVNGLIFGTKFSDRFFNAEINKFVDELKENEQKISKNRSVLFNTKVQLGLVTMTLLLSLVIGLIYRKLYLAKQRSEELIKIEREKLVEKNTIIYDKNVFLDKQKNELEAQLKTKLLMLSNRNKVEELLISKIERLSIDFEEKRSFRRIINQSGKDKLWNRVEEEFLNSNKEFVNKLLELNPTLTPNNINLCILTKLGLTNKEIAEIRSISLGSVKVGKSRLKKSFGIMGKNVGLYTFLKNLDEVISDI